jgi:AraC family transcriptional regulator
MQAIGKALWYIESHFGEPLTLDDVARASGLSRFHLARTFAALVGQPVGAYARARRLTEAAKTLAGGAPDILAVALDAGYGSHEAFTRAFRDQFGATPDEVRARRSLSTLTLVEALRMPDAPAPDIQPAAIRKGEAMRFAGLRKYFRFEDRAGIPSLWQAFGPHIGHVPGQMGRDAYGLCLAPADPSDDAGFDYVAAVAVSSLDGLPEDLSGARLAARSWAVFPHAGHVSSIGVTCAAAGAWLSRTGCSVEGGMQMVEHYGPGFDADAGVGDIEVWVPVEE